MAKFSVTIQQVITTVIVVEAENAAAARAWVENYGPAEAAMDMGSNDTKTDRVKSVRAA